MRHLLLTTTTIALCAAPVAAQDRFAVNRIIDEGTNHSQAMVTAEHLSDVIGARLTNSSAVVPIARDWLSPFSSMAASTVAVRPTGGTDHVFMQSVGMPGFQFIQDPLDHASRVHHSGIDTFDHLKADDMRQGSIVLASVLLGASNADQPLPRPPLPTKPVVTDPFAYNNTDN